MAAIIIYVLHTCYLFGGVVCVMIVLLPDQLLVHVCHSHINLNNGAVGYFLCLDEHRLTRQYESLTFSRQTRRESFSLAVDMIY